MALGDQARTVLWKQGVKSGSSVFHVTFRSQKTPPQNSVSKLELIYDQLFDFFWQSLFFLVCLIQRLLSNCRREAWNTSSLSIERTAYELYKRLRKCVCQNVSDFQLSRSFVGQKYFKTKQGFWIYWLLEVKNVKIDWYFWTHFRTYFWVFVTRHLSNLLTKTKRDRSWVFYFREKPVDFPGNRPDFANLIGTHGLKKDFMVAVFYGSNLSDFSWFNRKLSESKNMLDEDRLLRTERSSSVRLISPTSPP